MPKFIVLKAATKYNDEDNVTIKTTYIDNFVIIVPNYTKEKRKWKWNKATKSGIYLKKN